MVKEFFNIFKNETHRTNLKIQVIAGLIIAGILAFFVWVFDILSKLWELIIYILKAVSSDMIIPLWSFVIVLLAFIFLSIKILSLQKIIGQNNSTETKIDLNNLDLNDKQIAVLAKLVPRYPKGLTLSNLSDRLSIKPLFVEQMLDFFIENQLIVKYWRYYHLSKDGRDFVIDILHRNEEYNRGKK